MSNFQSKVNDGFTKLQDRFEQGKEKLQIAQETARLKKEVNQQLQQKMKHLLNLGQLTHEWLRKGELKGVDDERFDTITEAIRNHDAAIYKLNSDIQALTQTGELKCDCGEPLEADDQFCPNCGQSTNVHEEVETEECQTCNVAIPVGANFCPSCGVKQ